MFQTTNQDDTMNYGIDLPDHVILINGILSIDHQYINQTVNTMNLINRYSLLYNNTLLY